MDLDKDGVPEVVTVDRSYDPYGLHGISPTVILRFEKGRYVPAADLMRQPVPGMDRLRETATGFREGSLGQMDLEAVVLDLIYTGHESLAWAFVDMAWAERWSQIRTNLCAVSSISWRKANTGLSSRLSGQGEMVG